jgi:protein tyrosine/serine phosphatase
VENFEGRVHSSPADLAENVCRVALWLCIVLMSGCVYMSAHTPRGACLHDLSSPVRNFCVVAPGVLWRGARPNPADAKWLLEQRVGTVVSVQVDSLATFEAALPREDFAHDVSYFQIQGFNPLQILSRSELDEHMAVFIAIVKSAPKPIYLHCRAGVDRAGVMVAGYRVLIEGSSAQDAIAEMARFHSPWLRLDARYVRTVAQHRTEILRRADELSARVRPTTHIECARGHCIKGMTN